MIETLSWQESALQWFEQNEINKRSADTLTRLDAQGKNLMCRKNLETALGTVKHLNDCFSLEVS